MKYYLSLGSNINPESNLELAISELNKILTHTKCSSVHKTQAEDGIRDRSPSRGLGDVYKRQLHYL